MSILKIKELERASFIAGLTEFGVNNKGIRYYQPSHQYTPNNAHPEDVYFNWREDAKRLGVELKSLVIPLVKDSGLIWGPLSVTEMGLVKTKLTAEIENNIKDRGENGIDQLDSENWEQAFGDTFEWTMYQFDPTKNSCVKTISIWDNKNMVFVYGDGWGIWAIKIDINKNSALKRYGKEKHANTKN